VFLLLSLLASAIQEVIAAMLALRAATLEKGLRKMLEEDSPLPIGAAKHDRQGDARNLSNELYGHPLIRVMYLESGLRGERLTEPRHGERLEPGGGTID
jgi:hypothetical protein